MTWLPRRRDDGLAATRLAQLFGYARGANVVIVTSTGVELPIPRDCRITVLELNGYLAWVESLPENTIGSRRV